MKGSRFIRQRYSTALNFSRASRIYSWMRTSSLAARGKGMALHTQNLCNHTFLLASIYVGTGQAAFNP